MVRRLICLFAALLLLLSASFAEETEKPTETEKTEETEEVTLNDSEFPPMNDQGFLDSGEFLYEDEEEGIWRYASSTLWVEVIRYIQKSPARVWYEAEIRCAEGSEMPHAIANDPENWMKKSNYPHKIARKNRTVIAVSSDYAQGRGTRKGIVIRDGTVYGKVTWKQGASKFPNLDTMAFLPDGDMRVFYSDELTADEYLDMGARDVFAFGPWLIRDGELNEKGLEKYGKSKAERVAVGMVEKGHYWFMMLEGRIKRSKGDGITFLTEKMQAHGVQQAFNLDGGQTACIVFMGHQLCKMTNDNRNKASRTAADILGVGTSDLCRAVDDPW